MSKRTLFRRTIPLSGSLVLATLVLGWLASLAAPLTPLAHAAVPPTKYHFRLDEEAGATSFSGTWVTGTCTAPACPTAGEPGQYETSARFDGLDDIIWVNQAITPVTDDSFTIAAWINTDQSDGTFLGFDAAPPGGLAHYTMFSKVGSNLQANYTVGVSNWGIVFAAGLGGGWNHVVVSCERLEFSSSCSAYINGVRTADSPIDNGTIPFISDKITLGCGPEACWRFAGNIDHVAVYDSPITDAQAAEIYAAAYANKPPVLDLGAPTLTLQEGTRWAYAWSSYVADPDAGEQPIDITITASYGTLTINGATPGGIVPIGCDFTGKFATLRLQGPQAELRTALSFLAHDPPDADFDLPVTLSFSLNDQGYTGDGGARTASGSKQITYDGSTHNDPPNFSVTNVEVLEDAGAVGPYGVATASPGPWGEASAQTISFPIQSNTNPALFSAQPAVAVHTGNGPRAVNLTPAQDRFGAATITLAAKDSGGNGPDSVDSAPAQSFTITVLSVNDAPLFTKGADQEILEDAGPQTVADWATGIAPGPANESEQTVSFLVANTNPALFSAQPSVDSAGALRYTSAPDAYGTATVSVRAQDTGGGANGGQDTSAPQTFVITVLPVNDAPVNHLPPDGLEVIQSRPVYFTGPETISISDVDVYAHPLTITLSAEHGVLSLAQVAGLSFSGGDGIEDAAMTFTGIITSVNAALASLDFAPTPGYLGPATVSLTVNDQGSYGQGGPLEDRDTLAMAVNAANAAPEVTFPGTAIAAPSNPDPLSFAVGAPPSLYPSSIPVLGLNGTVRKVTVTLHDLSHTFPADLDVLLVAPSGKAVLLMSDVAGSMDMEGLTLTFDDTAITGLPSVPRSVVTGSYRPTNYSIGVADAFPAPAPAGPWAETLSALVGDDPNGFWRLMVIDDFRETDAGILAGGWSLRITTDGLPYTGEGQDLVFGSAGGNPITVDDADAGAGPIAVTLSASAGTLSLGRTAGLSFYSGSGSGDQSMSFSGQIAALNAALEGLRYSAPTYSNVPAQVQFVLDDQGYFGAGGARVITATLKIFVNPVIDSAPSIAAASTDEDTQSDPISVGPGPADGAEVAAFQISAISGGLLFLSDGTTPVADGDFITAAQGASGLRFTPAPDAVTAGSFRARGTLSGDALGLGGPSSTATISVVPVNDPPTLAALSDLVLPATPGEEAVALAGITTGAANEGDSLSVSATSSDLSVIAAPVVAYTSPAAGGQLLLTSLGQTGSTTITVRVEDSGAPPRAVERSFVVVVGRLNDLPEIDQPADVSIDEDAGLTIVGLTGIGIGAADSGQSLTLTAASSDPAILPDPEVVYTSPAATGSLRLTPLPNAYGSVTVTLTLLDDGHPPLRTAVSFRVTVRPINDAPSFVKGLNETLDSNVGPRSIQLWATRISPGALEITQTVRFEVTADRPDLFSAQPSVDGAGTLHFTPQRNVEGVAIVSVTAVDDGGTERGGSERSATQSFRIVMLKDNVPPSFQIAPAGITVEEDFAGTRTLSVTPDPVEPSERGQVVSYRLSPASVDFANVRIDPATGTVTVTALPDANGLQTFTLIASDGQARNHTALQRFTLTVSAVNDPPTLAAVADITLLEDSDPYVLTIDGISAGPFREAQELSVTALSSDPAILPDPAVSYASPDGMGSLTLDSLPEQNGVVTVTVRVSDNGTPPLSMERQLRLSITAVNDAPTITAPLVLYADPSNPYPLRRIAVADSDAGAEPVRVTLRVASGQLSVAAGVRRGVTAAQISGNGSAKVVLEAPIAAISATLADRYGLSYRAQRGFIGPDPLWIVIDDQGHSGGAALSAQATVPLNVEPLADLDLLVRMREVSPARATIASTGVTREYSVEVVNKGPSTATGVTLLAQVPAEGRLVSYEAGGATCNVESTISCVLGTLDVQARVTLSFIIGDAPATGAPEDMHFQLSADQIDPSSFDETAANPERQYLPFVLR